MGRPSLGDRKSTAVRIPADLHEQLAEAAAERDVSVNFLVVRAVADFLPRLLPLDEIKFTRSEGSDHG